MKKLILWFIMLYTLIAVADGLIINANSNMNYKAFACYNFSNGVKVGTTATLNCTNGAGSVSINGVSMTNYVTGMFNYTLNLPEGPYSCRMDCGTSTAIDPTFSIYSDSRRIGLIVNAVNTSTVATGAIDADSIAASAITSSEAPNLDIAVSQVEQAVGGNSTIPKNVNDTVVTILEGIQTDSNAYDTDGEYATAIWGAAMSSYTTDGTFGGDALDSDVWTPTKAGYLDEAISGIDDNPWDAVTRTLTALDEDATTLDFDATRIGFCVAINTTVVNKIDTIDDFVDTEVAAILDDTGTSGVVLANDAITVAKIAPNAFTSSEFDTSAVQEIAVEVDSQLNNSHGEKLWNTSAASASISAADKNEIAKNASRLTTRNITADHGKGWYNVSGTGDSAATIWSYVSRDLTNPQDLNDTVVTMIENINTDSDAFDTASERRQAIFDTDVVLDIDASGMVKISDGTSVGQIDSTSGKVQLVDNERVALEPGSVNSTTAPSLATSSGVTTAQGIIEQAVQGNSTNIYNNMCTDSDVTVITNNQDTLLTQINAVNDSTYQVFISGSNEDQFKADVSALATSSGLTSSQGIIEQAVLGNSSVTYVDTEVSAIKAKTDNLPTDPADQSMVSAAIKGNTSSLATSTGLTNTQNILEQAIYGNFSGVWTAATRTLSSFSFNVNVNDTVVTILEGVKTDTDAMDTANEIEGLMSSTLNNLSTTHGSGNWSAIGGLVLADINKIANATWYTNASQYCRFGNLTFNKNTAGRYLCDLWRYR